MMWLWNKQLRRTTRNSSTPHSYQCVSRQRYCCQRLGFLTCAQTLMHATAYGGCMDTIRESALKADSLAALGTQIGISIPPGFSIRCTTNWATPAPMLVMRQSQRQNNTSTDLKKMRSQWWWGNYTETKYTSTDLKTMQVTMVTRHWHTNTKHSCTDLKTRMWQLSERVMMTCLERRSVVEEESNTGMTSSDDCSCPCSRSSRRCTSNSSEPDVTHSI